MREVGTENSAGEKCPLCKRPDAELEDNKQLFTAVFYMRVTLGCVKMDLAIDYHAVSWRLFNSTQIKADSVGFGIITMETR